MIVECPACLSRYDVSGRPPGTRARCRCGEIFELPEPPRAAGLMSCPSCGANVAPTSHDCEYCEAKLLVKACPRCFAKMFHGARHCKLCGAKVDVPARASADGDAEPRPCPRCDPAPTLLARLIGDVLLDECPECHGVWLDSAAVERVVTERRRATATAVIGMARKSAEEPLPLNPPGRIYIKCPDCASVMNRVNFGRTSGVIIDVCRAHGTWFDADELPRVVDFVMKGGLEEGERREIERMREEARRARSQAQAELSSARRTGAYDMRASNVTVFGGLLGVIGSLIDG